MLTRKSLAVGSGVVIAGCLTIALAGCSSNASSTASSTPTVTKTDIETKTATASPSGGNSAPCTVAAVQPAMAKGTTALALSCADGYAAVNASPDSRPIVKAEGSKWVATGLDCLTASASSLPSGVYNAVCKSGTSSSQ